MAFVKRPCTSHLQVRSGSWRWRTYIGLCRVSQHPPRSTYLFLTAVPDTQAYEQLFRSCIERKPDDVKAKLCEIQKFNPDIIPFNPLAVLAAREVLGEILQFCLERGVTWDRYLARACYEGSLHHPEVGKVIAPHAKAITRLTEGRKGPDGNYTPEQLEEWWGGINW
jgi:hypothetical protein